MATGWRRTSSRTERSVAASGGGVANAPQTTFPPSSPSVIELRPESARIGPCSPGDSPATSRRSGSGSTRVSYSPASSCGSPRGHAAVTIARAVPSSNTRSDSSVGGGDPPDTEYATSERHAPATAR